MPKYRIVFESQQKWDKNLENFVEVAPHREVLVEADNIVIQDGAIVLLDWRGKTMRIYNEAFTEIVRVEAPPDQNPVPF